MTSILARSAVVGCSQPRPGYDGTLNFGSFAPTEESWGEGDREILCYAYDTQGPTTGTLKGSSD